MRRLPYGGALRSQATAWQLPQSPYGAAPASRAIRIPAPVLNSVPRTFVCSHSRPRCWTRISASASNPPQARTTAPAQSPLPSRAPSRQRYRLPERARLPRTRIAPLHLPPPPARTAGRTDRARRRLPRRSSPPQKRRLPSTSNACRPYISTHLTPFSRIQSIVGNDCLHQRIEKLWVGPTIGHAQQIVPHLSAGYLPTSTASASASERSGISLPNVDRDRRTESERRRR